MVLGMTSGEQAGAKKQHHFNSPPQVLKVNPLYCPDTAYVQQRPDTLRHTPQRSALHRRLRALTFDIDSKTSRSGGWKPWLENRRVRGL